jgi:hypothetical protein
MRRKVDRTRRGMMLAEATEQRGNKFPENRENNSEFL